MTDQNDARAVVEWLRETAALVGRIEYHEILTRDVEAKLSSAADLIEALSDPAPSDEVSRGKAEEIARAIVLDERERCAKIADEFVERTNADIAHAIAAAIRRAPRP